MYVYRPAGESSGSSLACGGGCPHRAGCPRNPAPTLVAPDRGPGRLRWLLQRVRLGVGLTGGGGTQAPWGVGAPAWGHTLNAGCHYNQRSHYATTAMSTLQPHLATSPYAA